MGFDIIRETRSAPVQACYELLNSSSPGVDYLIAVLVAIFWVYTSPSSTYDHVNLNLAFFETSRRTSHSSGVCYEHAFNYQSYSHYDIRPPAKQRQRARIMQQVLGIMNLNVLSSQPVASHASAPREDLPVGLAPPTVLPCVSSLCGALSGFVAARATDAQKVLLDCTRCCPLAAGFSAGEAADEGHEECDNALHGLLVTRSRRERKLASLH